MMGKVGLNYTPITFLIIFQGERQSGSDVGINHHDNGLSVPGKSVLKEKVATTELRQLFNIMEALFFFYCSTLMSVLCDDVQMDQ